MYGELLTYIRSEDESVRKAAVDILLSVTASPIEEPLEAMLDQYLSALWRLACRPSSAGSKAALSALVNLADAYACKLASEAWIGSICEEIEERRLVGPVEFERLLFMLLTNITRESSAVQALVSRDIFLWRILQHFAMSGSPSALVAARDAGNYICNIFVNVSGFSRGREWFKQFTPADWDVFGAQCRWAERRTSALQVVKNIACDLAFIEESLEQKSENVSQILILLARLVCPSSKELVDQQKLLEISPSITNSATGPMTDIEGRKLVIECLTSLFRLKKVRNISRSLNLYNVLQLWHTLEDSADIMEAIEDVVHLVHYSEEELAQHDRQRPQC